MPGELPILLSELPPNKRQTWLAVMVAVLLSIAAVAAIPFLHRQLARTDTFIPVVDTILLFNDLVTAVLLYAQFSILQNRGVLALATGYLFTALLIVPHALTFPGAFSGTGLLGSGLQSTVWLYIFWHLGLPCAALAYAALKGRTVSYSSSRTSSRNAILLTVSLVCVLAAVLTWLATAGASLLPPIMIDSQHANFVWRERMAPAIVVIFLLSIALVWRRRSSVLDLWLLVVLWAWLIETALLSTTTDRFSLVWYLGRTLGLLSSAFVLLALLSEATMLYTRLALSVAGRNRDREAHRMTVETMVASIAHEIRQPLSALVANSKSGLHILARPSADLEEVRAILKDIEDDGGRVDEIIESIRTMFSAARERELLNVNDLIREMLRVLRIELKTHQSPFSWT
jgi:signal transduction histidine kinase